MKRPFKSRPKAHALLILSSGPQSSCWPLAANAKLSLSQRPERALTYVCTGITLNGPLREEKVQSRVEDGFVQVLCCLQDRGVQFYFLTSPSNQIPPVALKHT